MPAVRYSPGRSTRRRSRTILEYRQMPTRDETSSIECRFAPDETGVFTGYAAAWSKRDDFGDQWIPGVFVDSLRAHAAAGTRPLLLWHHDPTRPIGVWKEVREDDFGLKVTGQL